jgi:micrococcal nuclease
MNAPGIIHATAVARTEWMKGRCLSVHDGDTIIIQTKHGQDTLRLAYIDCPEMQPLQPLAEAAQQETQRRVQGKRILIEVARQRDGSPVREHYGRLLANVFYAGWFGWYNLNQRLLREGLAKRYPTPQRISPKREKAYQAAEAFAQRRRVGVWQTAQPAVRRTRWGWWLLGCSLMLLFWWVVK